ncbi:MAG: nicotinate phosphoribosyltransferase [Betaproteobacteria bacterium]|nr:nicotinate phosphoribosyltransferase [Betaproteobacteria bacterium]
MKTILPALLVDGYKVGHVFQYPADTEFVYSNLTPRKSRLGGEAGNGGVVFFGLQYFIQEYLVRQFSENFFARPEAEVMAAYQRRIDHYLGPGAITYDHIRALHRHGHLPLRIKALPEGSIVPHGVPMLTLHNTDPRFFWVTNMLETILSAVLWKACTSATSAHRFRATFEKYSALTVSDAPNPFIDWQGHDFSFRGMSGLEDAALSGAAHLLSFTGTDTVPAIDFLETHYGADVTRELVGGSVSATEHSVMCMGLEDNEQETFRRLMEDVYPAGIVSIVSDTWDFWNVLTDILPALKDRVMARNGKLVIRPDSGDPVKIINGDPDAAPGTPAFKGAIRLLDETFGHTLTAKGYKLLDPHVGLIYGDSITAERQDAILGGLMANGYASDNVVLGIGSYNYQYVTRDTHGFAIKATFGTTRSRGDQAIYKDPKTDDGTKRSALGLLRVDRVGGRLVLRDGVSRAEEAGGELVPVFEDGKLLHVETLAGIRARLRKETT